MITRTRKIDVDFHTHILPFMDDGAIDVAESVKMLSMLGEQGIRRVAATSHFDVREESVTEYISRRALSYEMLCSSCDMSKLPEIVLGAEVYCTEGISSYDLSPLCYEGTDLLLFELPRRSFGEWIQRELEVIAYKQKLVPVIAHIDRYMDWYSDAETESLLSFEDAVFQVNNNAFFKKNVRKKVCDIIKDGYRVVLGSDTHDLANRRPNFDLIEKEFSKFKHRRVSKLLENSLSTVVI